jgi:2-polyprenyl-3-methyl-5-hydroxy-6-metoxy-1,4-benzoquinol methylase
MPNIKNRNLYESKVEDYFSAARKEILDLMPRYSERVLEIGCGSGQTLELLKKNRLCKSAVGIELFENAANSARTRVDKVYQLDIEKDLAPPDLGQFDLILILDVLEHLIDPWSVLKRINIEYLKPGGKMIISLPNARHFTCLLPLLIKGDFNYLERGILDKTHLRFFTRKSGTKMLDEAGLSIEKIKFTSLELSLNSGKLNAVTFGLFAEFLTSQYIYLVNSDQKKGDSW